MRLLIVSDLHGNAQALDALVDGSDAVVFLGDAVDYGADPHLTIDWVRSHATFAVRGNHDDAVANATAVGAASGWSGLAERSAAHTRERLDDADRAFLGTLPTRLGFTFGGARFEAVHAAPLDPLHTYLPPETPEAEWRRQLAETDADWLLFGHTHRPFQGRFGGVHVLNPGSVGQPRAGLARASYAIWEDGDVHFAAREYDVEGAVAGLLRSSVAPEDRWRLVRILRTGEMAIAGDHDDPASSHTTVDIQAGEAS